MAEIIVALGSNLDEPLEQLRQAALFLKECSTSEPELSPIYRSEPVGPSENDFLNAVALIRTEVPPNELLRRFKEQEKRQGRPSRYPRWTARTLDLDIISYGNLVVDEDNLIIPHPEYKHRLFVLLPLKAIRPEWTDPVTDLPIDDMIRNAPGIRIQKTQLTWKT